ncbi:MAG: hypothetical protein ACYTF7_11410, partial [Planctomycetota bacterium]
MWRRRERLVLTLCVVCLGAPSRAQSEASARHDEQLSRFLRLHDLDGLLGEHLERRLERARGDRREQLSRELVELYGGMLEDAQTLEDRERLERRSRDLLDVVDEASSMQLRLELSRLLYEKLEEIVDRWRIGRATPEEIASTLETLRTLASELHEIGVRADQRAAQLRREEERSDSEARGVITQRLEGAQSAQQGAAALRARGAIGLGRERGALAAGQLGPIACLARRDRERGQSRATRASAAR